MDILVNALACMGAVSVILTIIMFICMGVLTISEKHRVKRDLPEHTELEIFKIRLHDAAYWFTEDIPTYRLIEALALDNKNIDSIREEWRKDRLEYEKSS